MRVNREVYYGGKFEYLSEGDIRQIHLASLEILENTGVLVYDDEALQLLKEGGAYVDDDKKLAKIPPFMVQKALTTAPPKITFYSMDGTRAMQLYHNNSYYGVGTDLPTFKDPYTGELRPSVLKDVENVAKVTQEAKELDFIASMALASDVDQAVVDLYHFITMRKYCNKPNWMTATDYGNLKAIIDMAAVSAGGYNELRQKPTFGLYGEPVSPLTNSKEATQKLLLCAEYGIPATWASGIIAGGTGPATLAGTLALGNAEGLSGLVMHQLKSPGAPFIYGLVASTMDMKTSISCYGGAELPLMHAVVGQLGRFYDLPTYGTGGCSDSNCVDAQAGMEATFSDFVAALAGTNLNHDNAYLGAGLVGNLEMILMCSDIVGTIRRFEKGIEINDETLAIDLINKVGPGGQFMSEKHTFKHFKKETYYPEYLNRMQNQSWQLEGAKPIDKVLNENAIRIIEKETKPLLDEVEIKHLNEIIKGREKEIAEYKFHREDFE